MCQELGITVNELLSGERIKKEDYQEKLEENIISISAFTIFETESSWSSIYSVLGIIIVIIGLFREMKMKSVLKKVGISILIFIGIFGMFYIFDYIGVVSQKRPPIYRYITRTNLGETKIITYNCLFYNVYRINADSKNEYYIIDNKKEYNSENLPVTPFNRDKSGIDNIIQYKNKYVGNNSNNGNLIKNLPLSEFGYVFEIDSEKLGLIIDYHTTDWYNNDNNYIHKALIYNSVSIFMLIDNVDYITFNFSGGTYKVERAIIEKNYPNYYEIIKNEKIDKNKFNEYVENKMKR